MGTNTPKKNRAAHTTADQTLIDGFEQHGDAIPCMAIAGVCRSPAEVVATLQSRIDVTERVLQAHATWRAALEAEKNLHQETKPFVAAVRRLLVAGFGGHATTLAAFGLTEPEKYVATSDERRAAPAKAKATRARKACLL
jgi:hypothetical protein